jgi:hypothetical protein
MLNQNLTKPLHLIYGLWKLQDREELPKQYPKETIG